MTHCRAPSDSASPPSKRIRKPAKPALLRSADNSAQNRTTVAVEWRVIFPPYYLPAASEVLRCRRKFSKVHFWKLVYFRNRPQCKSSTRKRVFLSLKCASVEKNLAKEYIREDKIIGQKLMWQSNGCVWGGGQHMVVLTFPEPLSQAGPTAQAKEAELHVLLKPDPEGACAHAH